MTAEMKRGFQLEESEVAREPQACCRIFGINILTDFVFRISIPMVDSTPDLILSRTEEPFSNNEASSLIFANEGTYEDHQSYCSLFRDSKGEVIHFPRIATFYLRGNRIHYHLAQESSSSMAEICFLGIVLAYWLENTGIIALHGSAIQYDGGAVAFLAGPLSGKTSLAAALISRGHNLLSDDITAVDLGSEIMSVSGSYPQMRMWPEQLDFFGCDKEGLISVWPDLGKSFVPVGEGGLGTFSGQLTPLRCIYLPSRRDSGTPIEISPVRPGEALIELVRSSFLPRMLSSSGLQTQRFPGLHRMASEIPVRKVAFPNGFQNLSGVCEAIETDLNRL